MNLTLIGQHPVIVTDGQKQRFKDFDHLVNHINRNGLVDKIKGLEVLPEYWFNRLDPKPFSIQGNIHEAHVAQLITLS